MRLWLHISDLLYPAVRRKCGGVSGARHSTIPVSEHFLTTHGTKIRQGFLGIFILFTLFTYRFFFHLWRSETLEKLKLSGLVRPLSKGEKKKDVFEIGSYRTGLTLPDCVSLFYQ